MDAGQGGAVIEECELEEQAAEERRATVRVLVADDHLVYRIGIRTMLGVDPGFEVVGEATNGNDAIEMYGRLRPDVMLLDLRMPQKGGIEVVRTICASYPGARILIVTSYQTEEEIFQVIEAGALGYITKDMGGEMLIDAVEAVRQGRKWIAPTIASYYSDRAMRPQLTARELEVLKLMIRGLTNKEIANVLGVATSTIKNHVNNLLTKLEVADRTEAVSYCLSRGIVHPEDI